MYFVFVFFRVMSIASPFFIYIFMFIFNNSVARSWFLYYSIVFDCGNKAIDKIITKEHTHLNGIKEGRQKKTKEPK